jgi:uridine kinase
MMSPERALLAQIDRRRNELRRPIVVALNGRSGASKSTIARRLMRLVDVALVPLDDFYQTRIPESEWRHYPVEERLNGAFDWARVRREALEPLRAGRTGRWHAFDFARGLGGDGTYSLQQRVTELAPAPSSCSKAPIRPRRRCET